MPLVFPSGAVVDFWAPSFQWTRAVGSMVYAFPMGIYLPAGAFLKLGRPRPRNGDV